MPLNQEAFVTPSTSCFLPVPWLRGHWRPLLITALLFLPSTHTHLTFTHCAGLWAGWVKTGDIRELVRGQRGLPEANMETVTMISQKLTVPVSMWLVLVATTRKLSMSLWTELPQAISRQGCS